MYVLRHWVRCKMALLILDQRYALRHWVGWQMLILILVRGTYNHTGWDDRWDSYPGSELCITTLGWMRDGITDPVLLLDICITTLSGMGDYITYPGSEACIKTLSVIGDGITDPGSIIYYDVFIIISSIYDIECYITIL